MTEQKTKEEIDRIFKDKIDIAFDDNGHDCEVIFKEDWESMKTELLKLLIADDILNGFADVVRS